MPKKISYFHYMKPHLLWLVLGPIVIAMGGVLEIFQTNFMADIVNTIENPDGKMPEQVMDVILSDGGIMCLITLAAIVAGIVGVVLLILISQMFKWPGAIQPGGVVLCIILFNTPVDTYIAYSLNRMLDTGIGVIIAWLVNYLLPRGRVYKVINPIKTFLGRQNRFCPETAEAAGEDESLRTR